MKKNPYSGVILFLFGFLRLGVRETKLRIEKWKKCLYWLNKTMAVGKYLSGSLNVSNFSLDHGKYEAKYDNKKVRMRKESGIYLGKTNKRI